jgi:hypothetical protein
MFDLKHYLYQASKYAKLAPGAVADEAAILDQLATERTV